MSKRRVSIHCVRNGNWEDYRFDPNGEVPYSKKDFEYEEISILQVACIQLYRLTSYIVRSGGFF
jgi:hypothetical protein